MDWSEPPENESVIETDEKRGFAAALAGPWLRFVNVFASPGDVMAGLVRKPYWFVTLVIVAALHAVPVAMHREAIVELSVSQAMQNPDMNAESLEFVESMARTMAVPGTIIAVLFFAVLLAFIYWLAFKVLGDRGGFRQWLAINAHAAAIPAALGIVYALVLGGPASDATDLPRISLGFFAGMDGFAGHFLNAISLESVWAALVIAVGARAINPERSFGNAAGVTIAIMLVGSLIAAGMASFSVTVGPNAG